MAVNLVPGLSVSPQISVEEVAELAGQGFQTIICNRPDGESVGQPGAEEIARAAQAAGLAFYYVPVVSGQMTAEHVHQFSDVLAQSPGPVLAYCRSGTRSTTLWALSQKGKAPAAEIIAKAALAGFDLSPLAPLLG